MLSRIFYDAQPSRYQQTAFALARDEVVGVDRSSEAVVALICQYLQPVYSSVLIKGGLKQVHRFSCRAYRDI